MKQPPLDNFSLNPADDSEISKRYIIELTPRAARQFKKLPPAIAQTIVPALRALADDPRPQGCKKLVGRPGYRIRVGDYRAVYLITDQILLVEIIEIGNRREVYG